MEGQMSECAVELAQRGQMTIPKELRDKYGLETGQKLRLIDLGGTFLLSPRESRIDALCDDLRDNLENRDASLEEMLGELRRARLEDAS